MIKNYASTSSPEFKMIKSRGDLLVTVDIHILSILGI